MSFLDFDLDEDIIRQLEEKEEAYIPVDSTAIRAFWYRRDQTLTILFTDGSRYPIHRFPHAELSRWLRAPSIGGFFNLEVRGRYL